jgi:CheY-like chemotaxis protein
LSEHEKKPLRIDLVVKEALKLLRATLPMTIEIRQDLQSSRTVLADPTQIHQVVMNLCTNAGHAMGEHGGVLDLSLKEVHIGAEFTEQHPEMRPGIYLQLTVSDTGHGMPPEVLERIFDPFYSTKESGQGTGLGLSVVHGIVKSCGGAIYAYSEPGSGSSFKVYLPTIGEGAAEPVKLASLLPTGSERILLVDDEEALVESGRLMLEALGYQVSTADSGPKALELFRAEPDGFDLVITDQTMPKMTGDELAAELMAIRPGLPIVICTGFSTKITKEKARAAGIRAFVMKPLLSRELAETVRRVLDKA